MQRGFIICWLISILATAFSLSVFAHGDVHERITAVTTQILSNAANPELWLLRADLRRQHGEFRDALADLEIASRLKPGWSLVMLQRARIFFDTAKFSDCERAATDCLRLDAVNVDAQILRARSLVHLGNFSAAAADYDAVLNPTNAATPLPDLYLERARAKAELKHFDDAIRGLDDGIKRLGQTPSLALPAIEYERQRGAFEAALERLDRAKGFFDNETFVRQRGEILKQAGRN